jgi:hypothetical protein
VKAIAIATHRQPRIRSPRNRHANSIVQNGIVYPEKDLNDIIKPIHWDTATLRREMIGYHMMERERGVYWRVPEDQWREEIKL